MNDLKNYFLCAIISFTFLFILGFAIHTLIQSGKVLNEQYNKKVDSLEYVNTTIREDIKVLDSIQIIKQNEVKTLSNDSTLELFYQLIRK